MSYLTDVEAERPTSLKRLKAVEFEGKWFSIPENWHHGEVEFDDDCGWFISFDPEDSSEADPGDMTDLTFMEQFFEDDGDVIAERPYRDRDRFTWQVVNNVVDGTRVRFAFDIRWYQSGYETPEWDCEISTRILEIINPADIQDQIVRLCEVAATIGFCECGNWRDEDDLSKKWKSCERCAKVKEAEANARAADPLYDARKAAVQKLLYRTHPNKYDQAIKVAATVERIEEIIKLAEAEQKEWRGRYHAMYD